MLLRKGHSSIIPNLFPSSRCHNKQNWAGLCIPLLHWSSTTVSGQTSLVPETRNRRSNCHNPTKKERAARNRVLYLFQQLPRKNLAHTKQKGRAASNFKFSKWLKQAKVSENIEALPLVIDLQEDKLAEELARVKAKAFVEKFHQPPPGSVNRKSVVLPKSTIKKLGTKTRQPYIV